MDARRASRLEAFLWIAAGIIVCAAANRLPLGEPAESGGWLLALPGPGFFPLLLALALIALGVTLAVAPPTSAAANPAAWFDRRTASVVIGLLVYAALFERLGFVLSTFLFLLVLFRGISQHRIAVAVGVAAVTSLTAWTVFGVWLQAQLPRGIFAP